MARKLYLEHSCTLAITDIQQLKYDNSLNLCHVKTGTVTIQIYIEYLIKIRFLSFLEAAQSFTLLTTTLIVWSLMREQRRYLKQTGTWNCIFILKPTRCAFWLQPGVFHKTNVLADWPLNGQAKALQGLCDQRIGFSFLKAYS